MISIYVETNYILELAFSQEQAESCLRLLEIHERSGQNESFLLSATASVMIP